MGKHPLYNQSGLQKNNKSHVLYALANKQMELKQLEDEYKNKISKIKLDLTALEITICLFDGDCHKTLEKLNTTKRRPYKSRLFKNNELRTLVLRSIKESNSPITNNDIALKIQTIKNININIWNNVKDCTKILLSTGIIKNADESARENVYIIA